MKYPLLFATFISFAGSQAQDLPSSEERIFRTFLSWRQQQITKRKMSPPCPEYGSKEFQQLLEKWDNKEINQENRWGVGKMMRIIYNDFNDDGRADALVTMVLDDCVVGNGYVGDPERSIIILSRSENDYHASSTILDDMYAKLNMQSKRATESNKLAYVEIQRAGQDAISGIYRDWQKSDGSNPTIKRYFAYEYRTKKLHVNTTGLFPVD